MPMTWTLLAALLIGLAGYWLHRNWFYRRSHKIRVKPDPNARRAR